MSNPYPPDPYSQPSGYDPYQQTYQQQSPTYQQYSQPSPGAPGSYSPYQQPQSGYQSGYQQYSQPGSSAYGPQGSQPQIVVNVQQGQSQYQMQPMLVAVAPPTNGKATASMVLGLCTFVVWFLAGIPAVILGHLALKEINASNGMQGGRGQAITGLVLGYLSVAGLAFCAFWYFFVILAAAGASQ
jgi:hypothetical protein